MLPGTDRYVVTATHDDYVRAASDPIEVPTYATPAWVEFVLAQGATVYAPSPPGFEGSTGAEFVYEDVTEITLHHDDLLPLLSPPAAPGPPEASGAPWSGSPWGKWRQRWSSGPTLWPRPE